MGAESCRERWYPRSVLRRGDWLRRMAALAVAAGIAAVGYIGSGGHATAAVGNCTPDSSWPAERADLEAQVLSLVNAHRTGMGLPALQTSPTLAASAVWKARHMAAYNERTHDDQAPPVARTFVDRVLACGYSGAGAGENIAWLYPTAASVMAGWLASPDHKANMEAGWTATGIGAAMISGGAVYWAEDFGFAGSSPPPPTTTAPTTTATAPPPTTTAPPATTTARTTTTSSAPPSSPPPTTTSAAAKPPVTTTTATAVVPKASLGPRCIVPNVFHLKVAVAKRKVRARGCAARVVEVKVRKLAAGKVAWQSPRRRVNMPAGSVVTLAVSARH